MKVLKKAHHCNSLRGNQLSFEDLPKASPSRIKLEISNDADVIKVNNFHDGFNSKNNLHEVLTGDYYNNNIKKKGNMHFTN